jgi:hypothetical protein
MSSDILNGAMIFHSVVMYYNLRCDAEPCTLHLVTAWLMVGAVEAHEVTTSSHTRPPSTYAGYKV